MTESLNAASIDFFTNAFTRANTTQLKLEVPMTLKTLFLPILILFCPNVNFEKKPGHPDVYLLPAISRGCVLFPYRMVLIHPQASPGGLFRLWPHPSSSLPITEDNDSAPNSSVVVWVFFPPKQFSRHHNSTQS